MHQQVELQKAQLAALTELNVGLRDALLQLTDAIAIQRLSPPTYPALASVTQQHRDQLWKELEVHYQYLTKRTEALQKDYMRSMDSEARISIEERLAEAKTEREQIVHEMQMLEQDGLSPRTAVYHNLPRPDYEQFIGRGKETEQIRRLLHPDSRHFLITIDGIGGIGKSALAIETAYHYLRNHDRLPPEERFDAIVWTSAKTSTLTGEGTVPRVKVLRTLSDIYKAIAATLEREDIVHARPDEQDRIVFQVLKRQRTLLAIDNLETIDDEQVIAFLRELPNPTKAIVTTRYRIDVAYSIRLMGMTFEDASDLIQQECIAKGISLTMTQYHKLYERTGGVPLAIVWSIGQMGLGFDTEGVIRKLGEATSDIARFCFEESVSRIRGRSAHHLLLTLSTFQGAARREVLGIVSGMEKDVDARVDGLATLERLSLVNRQSEWFSLLPLARSFAAHELMERPDFARSLIDRQYTYFQDLLVPPRLSLTGDPYWDGLANWRKHTELETEWTNISGLISQLLKLGRHRHSLQIFLPTVYLLGI